jgi:hypothetical protein
VTTTSTEELKRTFAEQMARHDDLMRLTEEARSRLWSLETAEDEAFRAMLDTLKALAGVDAKLGAEIKKAVA